VQTRNRPALLPNTDSILHSLICSATSVPSMGHKCDNSWDEFPSISAGVMLLGEQFRGVETKSKFHLLCCRFEEKKKWKYIYIYINSTLQVPSFVDACLNMVSTVTRLQTKLQRNLGSIPGEGTYISLTPASRPVLGPIQPRKQWIPRHYFTGSGRCVNPMTHFHLFQRLRMSGGVPPLPRTSWYGLN
jgi:hypothetical protein